MPKPPQVPGLMLCQQLTVDPVQRRIALEGLLLLLRLQAFPTAAQRLTAYALLFGGRGEGEMTLLCTHLETELDVHYHKRWVAFAEPGQTLHYEVRMQKLVFPRPGRYAFTLIFDSAPLTIRYLDVLRA